MFDGRFSQLPLHYELDSVRMPVYDAEYDVSARKLHAERYSILCFCLSISLYIYIYIACMYAYVCGPADRYINHINR